MILFILALVSGGLTALAPCVLPLLPVIIGGALSGDGKDKSRPYWITGSLALSLILFTYLLKVSSVFIGVPPRFWVLFSAALVIGLGIVSLFPNLWERLVGVLGFQQKSDKLLKKGAFRSGKVGAIITGFALGPVFSSCSPTYAFILATVLPRNFVTGFAYLMTYIVGLTIVLLLISVKGRKFLVRFSWAVDSHSKFRRSLGALFIIVGIAIATGVDKKVELWVTVHTPFNVSALDQKLLSNKAKSPTKVATINTASAFNVTPYQAPEFNSIKGWINSAPLTIASLRGKVVLVDFWTYSCINCVRTLPYVESWYEKYKSKGLVIIGVHAPEFSFEKVRSNVQAAVKQRGLTYPIALDNDLGTWGAYANEYWPAHYLIDRSGKVVGTHFGEGDYSQTEAAIQKLLGTKAAINQTAADLGSFNSAVTAETYFGSDRAARWNGVAPYKAGLQNFSYRPDTVPNSWTLGGLWNVEGDKVTSESDSSRFAFNVTAKDVYLVASTNDGKSHIVNVSTSVGASILTPDEPNGHLMVTMSNIYHIAHLPAVGRTTVYLTVPKGVSLNTFTFGG